MKIKFLRNCTAPQQWTKINCPCCGPERQGFQLTDFHIWEEVDPNETNEEIDLTALTYKVDYEIIEYP